MRTRLFVPLASIPLALVPAAPAMAAAPTWDPATHTLTYVGTDSEWTNIVMGCYNGEVLPFPEPKPTCADVEHIVIRQTGVTSSYVYLASIAPPYFPSVKSVLVVNEPDDVEDMVLSSPYSDQLFGDDFDKLYAGPGDDLIVGGTVAWGDEGNDVIVNAMGGESVRGGGGDDRVIDSLAAEMLGGPGDDDLELDLNTGFSGSQLVLAFAPAALWLGIDGDTPLPLEVSEFEHLLLTLPDGGAQSVDASGFPGVAVIRGFSAADSIIGTQQSDTLRSGAGPDAIDSRDGVVDVVDCGAGADIVVADVLDKVTNCETVSLPVPDTSAIAGPKKVVRGKQAKFTFSSIPAGATFQCAVDKKAFKACTSPFTVKTKKLSLGKHKLQVKAGADPTPASKTFKVKP